MIAIFLKHSGVDGFLTQIIKIRFTIVSIFFFWKGQGLWNGFPPSTYCWRIKPTYYVCMEMSLRTEKNQTADNNYTVCGLIISLCLSFTSCACYLSVQWLNDTLYDYIQYPFAVFFPISTWFLAFKWFI